AIQLAGLDEIGTDTVFKVFGLTDINQLIISIPILIHPRPMRYLLKRFTVVKFGHVSNQLTATGRLQIFKSTHLQSEPKPVIQFFFLLSKKLLVVTAIQLTG